MIETEFLDYCNNREVIKSSKRDISIDILRSIAILGIIIAHIEPNSFWFLLRSFDVPLMVILSAVCINASKLANYKAYCIKRVLRLVVPIWIFCFIYFGFKMMIGYYTEPMVIIKCLTLTTSWYFWIIRILFIMALLTPLFFKYIYPMSDEYFWSASVFVFVLTYVVSYLTNNKIVEFLLPFIPYSFIYCYGLKIKSYDKKTLLFICGSSFCIFSTIAFACYYKTGHFVQVGKCKFPPSIYYVSYAYFFSTLLWLYRKRITEMIREIKLIRLFSFIGSHSLWIYLWHIFFVQVSLRYFTNSFIRFIFVIIMAVGCVFFQQRLIYRITNHVRKEKSQIIKTIFIG